MTYYRDDLALVHHRGFGFHADACAPGILALLEPVQAANGVVVELGCGSGLLTRHLTNAGHRVIATVASTSMLELAREYVPAAEDFRQLVLPDDEIPEAEAIVSVGHVLSYLPDEPSIERALLAAGRALRPGGVLALDLCDLRWAELRSDARPDSRLGDDWAIITFYEVPTPRQFVRRMTTFVRNDDGSWKRDDERHDNVMIDVARVPALLATVGVDAVVRESFGTERLPDGLYTIVGHRQ